ncbi:DUF938 domain-containing protein [Blastomonas aquatica]|uniref:SAM-dependent methyltransferase n=1 Tax=Blastomonas aquatica TaxID=1510276 RepID=A0ABQ1JBV4_9SPHN|nr:DUF938 domain-containing protein [Blastomonas aquatica]GGB64640.1 SAM-dependent methyltransferase [Blastomonas aquatica]
MTEPHPHPRPWLIDEAGAEARRHAPATLRNRDAISDVLREHLPTTGNVLEIASGSGEHIVHFARAFPQLVWQPSDCEPAALASIAAWAAQMGASNVRPPLLLDAAQSVWPIESADAIICINMVHISPWDATLGLFKGCTQALAEEAPIILYGPYLEEGVETAASNLAFDESLKARNPAWGLRHLDDMDRVASDHGFARTSRHAMPANNLTLVYRKR